MSYEALMIQFLCMFPAASILCRVGLASLPQTHNPLPQLCSARPSP